MVRSSTYDTKRNEKSRKKIRIVLAEKQNLQEATEKSRNMWQNEQKLKIIRRSNKSKKSWTVPHVMHEGGVEVGPPEMPGVHQPSTFSRKISISMFIPWYIV